MAMTMAQQVRANAAYASALSKKNAAKLQAASTAGTGLPSWIQDLLDKAQAEQTESKAAQEQRYQDILDLAQNLGVQGAADIAERGVGRQSDLSQQMISSGLYGSSASWAPGTLINRETEAETRRLNEDVAAMKMGVMERRTDTYPDLGLLSAVMGQAGQARGGVSIPSVPGMAGTTRPTAASARTAAIRAGTFTGLEGVNYPTMGTTEGLIGGYSPTTPVQGTPKKTVNTAPGNIRYQNLALPTTKGLLANIRPNYSYR
jgi:hypothetical protein